MSILPARGLRLVLRSAHGNGASEWRTETQMMKLARFRADPSKIRVSIRHVNDGWFATVSPRNGSSTEWQAHSMYPEQAILWALQKAKNVDGLNSDLEQCYDHPYQDPL